MKTVMLGRRKLIVLAFLALFGFTMLTPLIRVQKATAASPLFTNDNIINGKFTWYDRAYVKADFGIVNMTFFDRDIGDANFDYSPPNYDTCDQADLEAAHNTVNGQSVLTLSSARNNRLDIDIKYPGINGDQPCHSTNPDQPQVAITGPGGNIFYATTSSTTIERVDGDGSWRFTKSRLAGDDLNYIRNNASGNCPDMLHRVGDNQYTMWEITNNPGEVETFTNGDTTRRSNILSPAAKAVLNIDPSATCYFVNDNNHYGHSGTGIYANRLYPLGHAGVNACIGKTCAGSGDEDDGGAAGGGVNFDCEVKFWNPLTWILCPVVELLQGFLNWFDQQIDRMLHVDPDYLDPTEPAGRAFYSAWSSVRVIALVLMVVFGLIMVIGQTIASGPFDAYTVKKVLPRLVVAVIGVALSWNLMRQAVTLTNDLGGVLRGAINAPFDSANFDLPKLGIGSTGFFAAGIGLSLIGTSFLAAISFLLTAALAVLIAFFVLLVRQIVIMMLIVIAPLAIICYILPNTQKAWKIWWESFSKALLMYPIIVVFIATGRVFAKASTATNSDTIHQVIAFAAYFIPYFLLPATFRLAGGALSTIGGFVNDRGKGGFDRLRNFRKQQYQTTMEKNKAGNRLFGGRVDPTTGKATNLRGKLNRGMQNTTLLPTAASAGGIVRTVRDPRGQINAIRRNASLAGAQEVMKDQAFATLAGNEDNIVGMSGTSRSDIEGRLRQTGTYENADDQTIKEVVDAIVQLQRTHGAQPLQIAALQQKASSKNAFNRPGQMEREIVETSGGDMLLASNLLAPMRQAQTQAGRADNVDAFGAQMATIVDVARGRIDTGQTDAQGRTIYVQGDAADVDAAAGRRTRRGALQTTSAGQIMAGTTRSVENLMQETMNEWTEAVAAGNTEGMTNVAARISSFRNAMGSATPQVKEAVTGLLTQVGVNIAAPESVDQQLGARIVDLRGQNLSDTDRITTSRTLTENIRTRAGLYDVGNRVLTPEEIERQRQMGEGTGIPPDGHPDQR